jgi:hypothetical protein
MVEPAGGPNEHREHPHLRVVRPFGEPAVPRAGMRLIDIYTAGVGAGGETNGVFAVWSEGRGRAVIAEDGAYVGPLAVTTKAPGSLRVGRLGHELLPLRVYNAFKQACGMSLEHALNVIDGIGRAEFTRENR